MAQDQDFAASLGELYGTPLPPYAVEKLMGDASSRRYYRVTVHASPANRPDSVVIMQLPDDAFASDEGGARVDASRLPFLEVGDLLSGAGIRVPEVYVENLDRGQLVLEDLGPTTFEQHLRTRSQSEWAGDYGRAVDLLVEIHERCASPPTESVVARRRFDRDLLMWELDHFREWGLEALFGQGDDSEAKLLDEAWERAVKEIAAMPHGFVHRDYQSKNLMVADDGALTVIDFQDALIGPRVYDLVALLCDSYVALDAALQDTLIARYAAARRIPLELVRREFWAVALHRKLKDAGRFVFIDRVRGNPTFLQWYPQTLVYVGRAIEALGGFDALDQLLRARIPGFPGSVEKPSPAME
ncbi:MAG: phosphotransferase [Myxococcota bacterium]